MADSKLLSFALASFIIELTPGPNMAFLAALTVASGLRVGLAAVAGVALGLAIYGAVAALGLTAAIEQFPLLYEFLRWAGVAYLLWLAWEGWRGPSDISAAKVADETDALRRAFRRGLITNLLNPKAAIFYIAVVPAFVVSSAPVLPQTLSLTAIYVAIATAVHVALVLLANRIYQRVSDPALRHTVRRIMAVALAAVALWLALSTAR
jgi:threonine/homoserine/homoserine lactone efflux protein